MATKTPARGDERTARVLLDRHGRTYAEEAGIRLRNTPQPLFQVLVLASLVSKPVQASMATAAARALFDAGMRNARRMADATWQQRVDALVEAHYRRYDESTATRLGEAADLLLDTYGGDLRRLRDRADGDPDAIRRLLRAFPGFGPTAVEVFLREVQAVWPEVAPCFDEKAAKGAQRLGLPESPDRLAGLVPQDDYAALAAALVRASLDKSVAEDVKEARRQD